MGRVYLSHRKAVEHHRTPKRKRNYRVRNRGHVLECGSALPLYGKSTRLEESEHQDKNAGDHQREHPHEIDVEPRAAQYRHPKFFVNHDSDQRGR